MGTRLTCALALVLAATLAPASDKDKPPKSPDPYGTAERETVPAVAAGDLAYKVILFDTIDIPENLKNQAKYVDQTENAAIARLKATNAFTTVDRKTDAVPEEPYLVVKCAVLDHHIVGGGARMMGGALAGKSHVIYKVKLLDGKTGDVISESQLSTANNAFSGAFMSNDKKLVPYLGRVIGDYVILRARTDKGVSVIPMDWPPQKQ